MQDNTYNFDRRELEDYLERMVELQMDLTELKKEAKASGFNPPVLNWLSTTKANSPEDGGEKVINDLFQYAIASGMPLQGIQTEPQAPVDDTQDANAPMARVTKPDSGNVMGEKRVVIPFPMKFFGEVFMGITLASGLIWLLY